MAMKSMLNRTVVFGGALMAGVAGGSLTAGAVALTATDIFLAIDLSSVNDVGFLTGEHLFMGADQVGPPSLFAGTTGTTTSADGSYTDRRLPAHGSTAFPAQISTGIGAGLIPYDPTSPDPAINNPNLLKPWTLTFTNPSASNSPLKVATPSAVGFSPAPFASNVTIRGAGTTPTVSWIGSANGSFVNIYNKNQCTDGLPGNSLAECALRGRGWPNAILSRGNRAPSDSLIIPAGVLNDADHYVIQVAESITRDGTRNTAHHNEGAISRAEFNFSVLPADAPSGPIFIPTADSSGIFHFSISGIDPDVTYNLDPSAAMGYIYSTGLGNPNFASVTLPDIGNPNPYSLYLWDGSKFVFDALLAADTAFDFGPGGVDRFEILGIDPSLGVDPSNPTAFITALTFAGAGGFTGTMTPIVADVAEPASIGLLGIGLAAFGRLRRSRRSSSL
jgi:hypothetical protein